MGHPKVEGGVQFDIFPMNSTNVQFTVKQDDGYGAGLVDIHRSPRQFGLLPGSYLVMEDAKSVFLCFGKFDVLTLIWTTLKAKKEACFRL